MILYIATHRRHWKIIIAIANIEKLIVIGSILFLPGRVLLALIILPSLPDFKIRKGGKDYDAIWCELSFENYH